MTSMCPTCGPTQVEKHPRRNDVLRRYNCKEWLDTVSSFKTRIVTEIVCTNQDCTVILFRDFFQYVQNACPACNKPGVRQQRVEGRHRREA